MRKIGETPDETKATQFCDYLLIQGISTQAEDAGKDGEWAVWAKDEDQVEQTRAELKAFLENPSDEKYAVSREAEEIRKQREKENARRLSHQKQVTGASWSGGGSMMTKPRFTIGLIITCAITFFITDPPRQNDPNTWSPLYRLLRFVDPLDYSIDEDPLASISKGQAWRVFTPNLLHAGAMHLAMNMFGIFIFGGIIERFHGGKFLGLLILLTGTTAILLQAIFPPSLGGGHNVVGISGAVYGLFGYLWSRPLCDPAGYPNVLSPVMVILMFFFLFASIAMEAPGGGNVANVAHFAGLVSGVICAWGITRLG